MANRTTGRRVFRARGDGACADRRPASVVPRRTVAAERVAPGRVAVYRDSLVDSRAAIVTLFREHGFPPAEAERLCELAIRHALRRCERIVVAAATLAKKQRRMVYIRRMIEGGLMP